MLKILYLCAQPAGTSKLDLETESLAIKIRVLTRLGSAQAHVEIRLDVRAADLSALLCDVRPDVIHFGGHGRETIAPAAPGDQVTRHARPASAVGAPSAAILLMGPDGSEHAVEAAQLGLLVGTLRGATPPLPTRVVVLNACYSEAVAQAVAPHVDFTIGMRDAILDSAAVDFAEALYDALGWGETIDVAFKRAVSGMPASQVGIPHLISGPSADPTKERLSTPLLGAARLPRHADDVLLKQLEELPAGLDRLVIHAYYRCHPGDPPVLTSRPGEPLAVTAARAIGDPERGPRALLGFVRLLACANGAPAGLPDRLNRWIRAKILELPPAEQAPLTAKLDRMTWSEGDHHLLLQIEELASKKLALRSWLFDPEGDRVLDRPGADGTRGELADVVVSTLPEAKTRFLDHIADLTGRRRLPLDELWIALIVPFRLLGEIDVDQWPLDLYGTGPEALGISGDVRIRTHEPRLRGVVKQRWSEYRLCAAHDHGAIDPAREGALSANDEIEDNVFRFWIAPAAPRRLGVALRKSNVVCAGLAQPPPAATGGLKAIVDAGIPIAVWARRDCDSKTLQTLLTGKLEELPRRVRDLRIDAADEGDPGHHLSLLWDDPTREPGTAPD